MKSLTELPTTYLQWSRSGSTPPDFVLQGTDGVFATLTFLDEEHTLARVKTAEGIWTLKHLGILAPVVTLREEGGTVNLATFHPHALRHGKLEFQNGVHFDWVWLHEAEPSGAFLDSGGKTLVSLHAHSGRDLNSIPGLEQCEVDVGLAPSARMRGALLASLGWYLIFFDHLKERDAVASETSLRL
ncbi:MAG: hypothetical protein Q8K67_12145 [Geothrix sp.]|nr:hypothetical protein [Geothrix sp.]